VGFHLEQDKLLKFRQAVLSDVELKVKKIEQEVEEIKKVSLAQTEDEQLNDAYSYIQDNVAKIKSEYKLLISKKDLAAKQDVLLQRENYRQMILNNVRDRLRAFAKTDEYKTYLMQKFEQAVSTYSLDGSIVEYRPEDNWMEQEIKAKYPAADCTFKPSTLIKIGGFTIRNDNAGTLIDETFESKLQEQIPYFNQNCRIAAE
jgi:vacuolar-type H+-ATPase subunit E/Vma4